MVNNNNNNNANNNNNNNKIQMQELLSKIQKVSNNEEFESLYEQIFELLDESKHKTHERHFKESFVEKLVDLYLQSFSDRVFKILVGISTPLDECLFNILMKKITVQCIVEKRFAVFILISNIVHRSPSWLPSIINMPLLNCFFNILKNDREIVILAISALILVELLAALPCLMAQCLEDIFVCFSRLSTFLYKGMSSFQHAASNKNGSTDRKNLSFLNLNSIVYRVFIRLYAIYPCNFLEYLKTTYGMGCSKENSAVFRQIIQPMLNKIRFHPFLITASKDRECDKTRWFYKEPHDILEECGQYSIDPIESSSYFVEDVSQFYEFPSKQDDDDDDDDEITGNHHHHQQQEAFYPIDQSNAIFSELSEAINNNEREQNLSSLSSLKHSTHLVITNKTDSDNLESAQEAIDMSQKIVSSSTFIDGEHQQLPSSMNSEKKNLVKPVAISANAAKASLNSMQKKNINKKQPCFSPFEPIKEIGNVAAAAAVQTNNLKQNDLMTSSSKQTSPIDNHLFNSTQRNHYNLIDHHSAENDDVDIEIISYNLENGNSTKLPISNTKNQTQTKSNNRNEFTSFDDDDKCTPSNDDDNGKNQIHDCIAIGKLNDELIANVKSSFKQLNTRIRYQSNCQAETGRYDDDDDFGYSKSCPMLYFENVDDSFEIIKDGPNIKDKQNVIQYSNTSQETRRKYSLEKSQRVNLILDDPNAGLKQTSTSVANKTCKSVDFTKETKSLSSAKNVNFNRLLHESKRHLFLSSSSSIDFQTPAKLEFSSPHELLDRTLSTLSEFYLKDSSTANEPSHLSADDPHEDSNQTSRRDSILNTNSSASSSVEHIPSLNYLNSNPNEEDMRKILAIMYAQLVFERHQRNMHVIRNRRLYKKSKECIQLEEQFKSMQAQVKSLMKEIELMKSNSERNSLKFEKERRLYDNEIGKLQQTLNKYKNDYEELLNEKTSLELHYRLEIDGLNKNFRSKEVELNRFLCNFDKNVDLMKLEQENLELKNRMFLLGEFCGKIRSAYSHMKSAPEINDKFIYEALRFENEDLQKRNTDLGSQLKFFMEKCQTLENQIKQIEPMHKKKIAAEELEFIRECLKVKENENDVLKTLVVNYEAHIKKLNGEMIALKLSPDNNVISK